MQEYEERLLELKKQLCKLDLAIPGTIHIQYRKCGKSNCRCHQSQDQMHGPYYLWYRKIDGKLYTSVINESDLQIFNEMIENRVKLETLTSEMIRLGEHYATTEKLGKKNSKKT
jgi:hypothetical protein